MKSKIIIMVIVTMVLLIGCGRGNITIIKNTDPREETPGFIVQEEAKTGDFRMMKITYQGKEHYYLLHKDGLMTDDSESMVHWEGCPCGHHNNMF